MEITTKNMRALLINVLLVIAIVAAVLAPIGGGWGLPPRCSFSLRRRVHSAHPSPEAWVLVRDRGP